MRTITTTTTSTATSTAGSTCFTAMLGALIGLDLLLAAFAPSGWRAPLGVSLIWVAALLGAARIVYQALEAMMHGRVGADVALAVASVAALVLREPFVAAEVVFIALVGEVLEADHRRPGDAVDPAAVRPVAEGGPGPPGRGDRRGPAASRSCPARLSSSRPASGSRSTGRS